MFRVERICRQILLIGVFALSFSQVYADSYAKAIEAFRNNKPQEAMALFEVALQENPLHVEANFWLAITYEQTGKYDQAIVLLNSMLEKGLGDTHRVYFNLANNYVRKSDNTTAMTMYAKSIEQKPDYALAYYNRGNSQVRTGAYGGAKSDYEKFIALDANHAKVPDAKAMIAAINAETARMEKLKLEEQARQAEEARLKKTEEERRLAEEERKRQAELARLAEEERKRKLLESVFSNLSNALDDQKVSGPGSENVQTKEDQVGRED